MSWSYAAIGTTQDICKDIDAEIAKMDEGLSKEEFVAAAPTLKGMLSQNFNHDDKSPQIYRLTANGSGHSRGNGEVTVSVSRSMDMKLERLWGRILTPAQAADDKQGNAADA